MKPLADDLRPLGHHAADHRVRLDEPLPPDGKLQGAAHVPKVDFVLLHGVSDSGSYLDSGQLDSLR